MDEKLTRREMIDKRLEHVGWKVDDPSMVSQEFDIYLGSESGNVVREARSQYDGHQFADYLLLGKDATPLGVVEAKKTSKDAEVGQEQALQYAQTVVSQRFSKREIRVYEQVYEYAICGFFRARTRARTRISFPQDFKSTTRKKGT